MPAVDRAHRFPGWADEKRAKPEKILVKLVNSKDR